VGGRDEGERQTRCRIGELAENLREIAGALPFWRVDDSGLGIVVVATGLDEPLSDTSRRGQYHNTRYRELAEETHVRRRRAGTRGWDDTSVRESAGEAYEVEVRQLAAVLADFPRRERRPVPSTSSGSTGNVLAMCACSYRIWTSRRTLAESARSAASAISRTPRRIGTTPAASNWRITPYSTRHRLAGQRRQWGIVF
jgi:hypothetical protein